MLNRFYNTENYNCFSYGETKGTFLIDDNFLHLTSLNEQTCKKYSLVEKKSQYYKLIFDIDFKPLYNDKKKENDFFYLYDTKEDLITSIIIKSIEEVLKNVFIEPNCEYVYCDKSDGTHGVHLYYINIIVNNEVSSYLYKLILNLCLNNTKIKMPLLCWQKIIDACTTNSNGLRMPFFYKNGSYYKPNNELSTCKIPDDIKEISKLCLIRTNNTEIQPMIKDEIDKSNFTTTKIVKTIKIKDDIIDIDDTIDELDDNDIIKIDNDKKILIIKLLNVLSVDRLDDYNKWIHVIMLCKNYNLKKEAIEISKKSNKYDSNSPKIINNIFRTKKHNKLLKIGTLIMWCKEDNEIATGDILSDNFNNKMKLKINNIDDYLLNNYKDTYDRVINSKYIDDETIDIICDKIITEDVRTVLIHSPTDSGKTTCVNKIINKYMDNFTNGVNRTNILSIVSRRTMIATHLDSFSSLKLISYRKNHDFCNKYISSMEHLIYYNDMDYQVVILDEINSLLNYLYSSTLDGKRLQSYVNLCKVLKYADLIICCDSNATSMVHSFIHLNPTFFGNVYKLRNIVKNKIGIKMSIYNTKCKSLIAKLNYYCKMFIDDIKKNKSVIIFSDSKLITDLLYDILKKYNNTADYFYKINRNWGSDEEIERFNDIFSNKCLLISPKIVYGLNILIKYDNVYCFYKYTTAEKAMGAMEYHQQYSRTRNAKHVHIFDMNNYYEDTFNYYINYDDHIKNEIQLFNKKYEKYNNTNNEKNKNSILQLIGQYDDEKISIDTTKSFASIHWYKKWFDKLFHKNKTQLIIRLSEQAGYKISFNINIITDYVDTQIKKINTIKDKTIIENLYDVIINNKTIPTEYERVYPNVIECINQRIYYLGKHVNKELVLNDKAFDGIINMKYLLLSEYKFNKFKMTMVENDLLYLGINNKILNKINILFKLENELNMRRFIFDDLKKEKIEKYINIFYNNINDLVLFCPDSNSKNKNIKALTKKFDKIESVDQIQKFIGDCYNSFGEIIDIDKKRIQQVIKYIKFDFNNDIKKIYNFKKIELIDNYLK